MEFLRYPQVIATLFNGCAFGPPWCFTTTSPCSWIGHPVSGLRHATLRPIQTRFRFGSGPSVLNLAAQRNSPVRSTKSTRSHFKRAFSACKHRVSGTLSLPSRGSFHLSLTVLCAIGHQYVFRLGGWSPRLPTGFLVSCGTLDPGRSFRISRTGFLPSLIPLPNGFCYPTRCLRQSTTPIDRSPSVWPLPLSLAATQGISVDFSSSGYLDVSVPRVTPA